MKAIIKSLVSTVFLSCLISSLAFAATAVQTHGSLSVNGNQIVDQHGKPLSLAGPSLFWSNTGMDGDEHRYYNADVVAYVQKNWNAPIIRVAIGGTSKGGYLTHPDDNMQRAERVIDAAIAQGMYVIVDWHSHEAEKYPELAIKFFEAIATQYGKHPNLIYEIYNEPLAKTDWSATVKPYAEKVIPKIRAIDPDNLIVVGTQTWSQDVDKAADDPIKSFINIAYVLHFYAGTHKEPLRKKAEYALSKGIALMVTEWGGVNANGDGAIDKEETERWLAFMRKHQLTHCNWALSEKKEGASQLKSGTAPDGKWTDADLTESGLYVRNAVLEWHSVNYSGAKESKSAD
jgi:aryl-phospho-beta-D-glucosidase BglC (GH1 family)